MSPSSKVCVYIILKLIEIILCCPFKLSLELFFDVIVSLSQQADLISPLVLEPSPPSAVYWHFDIYWTQCSRLYSARVATERTGWYWDSSLSFFVLNHGQCQFFKLRLKLKIKMEKLKRKKSKIRIERTGWY